MRDTSAHAHKRARARARDMRVERSPARTPGDVAATPAGEEGRYCGRKGSRRARLPGSARRAGPCGAPWLPARARPRRHRGRRRVAACRRYGAAAGGGESPCREQPASEMPGNRGKLAGTDPEPARASRRHRATQPPPPHRRGCRKMVQAHAAPPRRAPGWKGTARRGPAVRPASTSTSGAEREKDQRRRRPTPGGVIQTGNFIVTPEHRHRGRKASTARRP